MAKIIKIEELTLPKTEVNEILGLVHLVQEDKKTNPTTWENSVWYPSSEADEMYSLAGQSHIVGPEGITFASGVKWVA